MAISSQAVAVPESKPVETTSQPRPMTPPADKPFMIKVQCSIPY